MPTIVEYSEVKTPRNLYPTRIVSPTQSKPCCFTDMEEVGVAEQEDHWMYQYKRCRKCGFTVRVILQAVPDAALISELRRTLEKSFQRNVPDL